MILLILAAAAAAAAPQPGELRTFGDWIVGCDNGLTCTAIALLPEAGGDGLWVTMRFARGSEPDDAPVTTLQNVDADPAALLADGRPLAVRFEGHVDGYDVVPDDPAAFIQALRQAQLLEARGADGASVGRVSLSGASAAMLYMDEQQRRLGTVTALVRTGGAPASSVPPPPALPVVTLAPAPVGETALVLSETQVDVLRREAGCTIGEVGGPDHHEEVVIAPGTTLVLLACGSGAYNVTSIPYIATRRDDAVAIEIAPFDSQWGLDEPEFSRPTLINGQWDAESRLLREYSKARGLGDCGTHASYGWDGARFRLVAREEMEECRGSLHYVPTWRTQVERP
jgi:hypothetical protein